MPIPLLPMLASAAIGMGVKAGENKMDYEQQKKLQALQIEGQKEMGEFNYQQQMRMWENTNYKAQMQQLQKAGLNPALLYGKGGGGGATVAANPGSVSGGSVGHADISGMAMQMGLMSAQKRLLEAQASKAEAEADKTAGVDTEQVKTLTDLATQQMNNAKAQEHLTNAQRRLTDLNWQIADATKEDAVNRIRYDVGRAYGEMQSARAKGEIDDKTVNEAITIIRANAIGAALENELKRANIEHTRAKINEIAEKLAQGWESLDIQKFTAEITAQYPGVDKVAGGLLNEAFELINRHTGGGKRTVNTMEDHKRK